MGYLHRDFLRENGFKSTYLFKRAEIFLFLDANLTWDFKNFFSMTTVGVWLQHLQQLQLSFFLKF